MGLEASSSGARPHHLPSSNALAVAALPKVEPRLLTPGRMRREDIREYRAGGGLASTGLSGLALIDAIESAGLRGRGGAAFPTGVKMRSVATKRGPRFVVANGEEGEPASVKDRWLLRFRPHLVLDGLVRCADAVDSERAFVFASDDEAVRSVALAIDELGGLRDRVEVVAATPGYVAGEETAVVRAIGGGPAKPTDKPPRPFEAGIEALPTLVANVETLANIPWIAQHGAASFRELGTEGSTGTFLLTLTGACGCPGLYEAQLGVSLREALHAAGGCTRPPTGFLMGGFFAGLLNIRALDAILTYDELRAKGSGLGCGAIVVLGAEDCPVAAAAEVMAFLARENAQQCGACIRGTAAMRDALFALACHNVGQADQERIQRLQGWSHSLRERGACALLDGAAELAGSLLREFPETVERHLAARCPRCATLMPFDSRRRTRFEAPF